MVNLNSPLIPRVMGSRFPNSALLWRCGAIMGQSSMHSAHFNLTSCYDLLVCLSFCNVVSVGMAASSIGTHALKGRSGITPDNVQTWLTASHYLVRSLTFQVGFICTINIV
jgi:hypothetical protein